MNHEEVRHLIKHALVEAAFPSMLVSGGQTGADRAALDFAIDRGLDHAGYCPKGRKSEDGPLPDHYQLTETKSADYPERTRLNVEMADATVVFHPDGQVSRGSALTVRHARKVGKPYVVLGHFPDVAADAADLSAFLVLQTPQGAQRRRLARILPARPLCPRHESPGGGGRAAERGVRTKQKCG
jgi:hypothetical protein